MTKYVSIKCPNCGANLSVDDDKERVKCDHCGSTIMVEKDMNEELLKTMNDNMKKGGRIFERISTFTMLITIVITIIVIVGFIFIGININKESKGNINYGVDTIKDESDKSMFNLYFSNLNGTNKGIFVTQIIDNVIDSNKRNKNHIIKIKYEIITTSNEKELISIKDSIAKTNDYEVSIDYDDDGYVNLVTIMNK